MIPDRALRRPAASRAGACALILCAATALPAGQDEPPASGYTPHRVYDAAAGAFVDFEALAARAAAADVVFFGEQHGHPPVHRLQHALLEGLDRRGNATLSLEMFERDVAGALARYLEDGIGLEALLAAARPWPNYLRDYHPLVEHARVRNWRVVAANAPRGLVSRVAREGLAWLGDLAPDARGQLAAQIDCPGDRYRARFLEQMEHHPMPDGEASPERFYEAQCLRDETMAESIVTALADGAARPLVHITGAFHSDFGDGTPARVLRRQPDLSILVVSSVAVPDLDAADPAPHLRRAHLLLFTLSTARPD